MRLQRLVEPGEQELVDAHHRRHGRHRGHRLGAPSLLPVASGLGDRVEGQGAGHEGQLATAARAAGLDVDAHGLADYVVGAPSSENGAIFMDIYARDAAAYLERSVATHEDFARVAVKS